MTISNKSFWQTHWTERIWKEGDQFLFTILAKCLMPSTGTARRIWMADAPIRWSAKTAQAAKTITGVPQVPCAWFAKMDQGVDVMTGVTSGTHLTSSASWATKTASITTGMAFWQDTLSICVRSHQKLSRRRLKLSESNKSSNSLNPR